MIPENYYTAWAIYLLSSAGLCAIFWKLSENLHWPNTTRMLRSSLIMLLIVPYSSHTESNSMAPAILIVLFESLFNDGELAIKAATPILMLLTAVIAATLVYSLASRNKESSDNTK